MGGADILLIDDDRDLVNSLRIILESQGHRVRAAHGGAEGWSQIQAQKPALIILDVMMSTDTEGLDLAYKLSHHPQYQDIPIILLSGFAQVMAQQGPEGFQHILGEDWPVAQYLEKPVDPRQLLAAVQNLLQG